MKCPKCRHENPEDSTFCGKCATKLGDEARPSFTKTIDTPREELTRGTLFAGRYEIIEELGKGGMGRVYRVEDTKVQEEVALKLIRPEISIDEKTIDRFRNELKIARKIRHKNITGMYDLGEDKGAHYITMEYVAGQDLRGLIRQTGQLTVGKTIAIGKEIAGGLEEAHRQSIVHRDLKPSNIMIDKAGNARIMDFGIARTLKGTGITGAGVMIGTPEYMSPEQVEGKEVDARSDIYSLGVILFEMLTGRVPFEGDTPFTVGVKQKSEAPQDPKLLNPAIPDKLSGLILKCLEKDKQKRCQNAAEVRSELENVEHGIQPTTRVVPIRKTTSREITVSFNIRKMAIPVILITAFTLAAVLIWKPWAKKTSAPALSDKPSLAIMYFKNNTGDENLDHWRVAISDLLVTDLSQSRYIKILSSEQLFDILSGMNQAAANSYTSKVLKDVAAQGGVKSVLVGSFAKAGDNFRIDITLQEAGTGELLSSERVEGKGEESIFSMVDELTRKIKADLQLSTEEIASDIDEELEKITTSSAEAFKFYIQGRMLHNEQKNRESIRMMEEAVAIDPGFAMAYRSMAMSFGNLSLTSENRRCLTRAFELSSRLSDRERYIIEADYYRESERLYDKAVAAYEKLLELYPDDAMGNTNLGILYNTLEEWDKAIELYERRIRNNPEDPWAYFNILDSYLAKGWPEKAKAALEGYVENYKENFMFRIYLAFVDLVQGRYDRALVEAEKADSLNPGYYLNHIAKGCVYRGSGDWKKAEAEYQKVFNLEEKAGHLVARRMLGAMYQLRGQFKRAEEEMVEGAQIAGNIGDQGWISDFHQSLTYVFLGSGRPERALEEATKSLRTAKEIDSLSRQKHVLLAKGCAEIESGRAGDAQKTAEALRALIDQDANKKDIRYLDLLMGKVMLDKGDYAGAIGRLIKAEALLPFEYFFDNDQVLFMDALAWAYFEQGDLDKARAGYEKITRLTVGAFYYGDIYARSFYMLGKIAERQGDKIKARENYDKFLDLWKDADPGLPEVEDANKRLTGLRG